eukprot:2443518-Pleurochrysis_carterae.AAC.1
MESSVRAAATSDLLRDCPPSLSELLTIPGKVILLAQKSAKINRSGGAVYPLRLCGLMFFEAIPGVASPDTLPSRSRYLLQCLASMIAASGGGDYGRTSDECIAC